MRWPVRICIQRLPPRSESCRALPFSFQKAIGRRSIQIQATPSAGSPTIDGPGLSGLEPDSTAGSPDARFEVLGSPYSLLSVSLSASQNLYTRRGTLVGLSGKADNAMSTMRLLEPFRRLFLGIPFLYQRISSTSPITALISVRSPITSFAVVHLNGTVDWMVAQRQALLAWTGHALAVRPRVNMKMSLAHWGNSQVTGRGLLALVGKGQIYSIDLKAGEVYVAHPSNIVGYTITQLPPRPYRLKSSTLRLQIPSLGIGSLLPDSKFIKAMRESGTWKVFGRLLFTLRTWSRRTIWGDRLFLQFEGPTTILFQSRASRINDILTTADVNELADTPPGTTQPAVKLSMESREAETSASTNPSAGPTSRPSREPRLSVASVQRDGKVNFKETENFQEVMH